MIREQCNQCLYRFNWSKYSWTNSPDRASTQGRSDRGQNRPRSQHNKQNTSLIMNMSNKTSNNVHKFAFRWRLLCYWTLQANRLLSNQRFHILFIDRVQYLPQLFPLRPMIVPSSELYINLPKAVNLSPMDSFWGPLSAIVWCPCCSRYRKTTKVPDVTFVHHSHVTWRKSIAKSNKINLKLN